MKGATHNRSSKLREDDGPPPVARDPKVEFQSRELRNAIKDAVARQALRWGIRYDQAQALLLDRKAVA